MFGIPAAGVSFSASRGRANAGDRVGFLGRAREKFGKARAFADNAPCHESAKAKTFPESLCGEMVLEYLPPHAPEPNPIEARRGRSSARPPARSSGRPAGRGSPRARRSARRN